MYRLRSIIFCVAVVAVSAVLILPAMAQFEVSPDHFSDPSTQVQARAASPAVPGVEIAAAEKELQGYYARIQRQADAVDRAQETAQGAGGMGESAYIFIDEYVRQQRELERLRKELAPQIVLAQARLDSLKKQALEDATAAFTPSPQTAKSTAKRARMRKEPVLTASVPKRR
jgi:hypothetical protein